jgi:hypothetical protein
MAERNSGKKTFTQVEALDALIERERRRLNHAEAILMCLSVALEECDDSEASRFSDAADAACSLISEAIDRLDSVNRDRVLAGDGDLGLDR